MAQAVLQALGGTDPSKGSAEPMPSPTPRQGKIKAEMKKKKKRKKKKEREGFPLSQGGISAPAGHATSWGCGTLGSHPNPGSPAQVYRKATKGKAPQINPNWQRFCPKGKTRAGGLQGWDGWGWDAVPCPSGP